MSAVIPVMPEHYTIAPHRHFLQIFITYLSAVNTSDARALHNNTAPALPPDLYYLLVKWNTSDARALHYNTAPALPLDLYYLLVCCNTSNDRADQ